MQIKAIYIPDLALPAKEGNFTFIYNKGNNEFEMEINKGLTASVDSVMGEDWLVFKTELTVDNDKESPEIVRDTNVEQISKEDLVELLLSINI